jgi:hypothetical protein
MPDDRIATVRPVEESEAPGRVAAIFAAIKKTKNIDFVPAFWRVIAAKSGTGPFAEEARRHRHRPLAASNPACLSLSAGARYTP